MESGSVNGVLESVPSAVLTTGGSCSITIRVRRSVVFLDPRPYSRISSPLDKHRGRTIEWSTMKSAIRILSPLLLFLVIIACMAATVMRNRVYENTVSVWKSMTLSSPNKRRPHQNYGQALSTAGNLQEALSEFKMVLSLDDDGSVPMRDIYREIGVVYFRLGLYEESTAAWQKGLEHAPYDAGLMNNLAIAYMRLNRMGEAVSYAEAAARSSATMPEAFNTLGEIYMKKDEPRKAVESFKRYLYLRPEDSRGYWNTALALRAAGDIEEALRYTNEFLARERDPRYREAAGKLLEHLNERLRRGNRS